MQFLSLTSTSQPESGTAGLLWFASFLGYYFWLLIYNARKQKTLNIVRLFKKD